VSIVCWIPKASNIHIGCVILIAFPLQQWLHERASVLRYTYIVCLVFSLALQLKISPRPPRCLKILNHTQLDIDTHRRTPQNELSAPSRGRYLHNTQHTQETNICTLSWIRSSDLSNRAAADPHLKPHGRRDRNSGCLDDEIKAGEMDWALSTQRKCVRNLCLYAWREYVTWES